MKKKSTSNDAATQNDEVATQQPNSKSGPIDPTPTDSISKLTLASLRLSQDFGASAGVKKLLTIVPVKKPANQSFIQVRPGEEWRMQAAILQLKEDGECYLVTPDVYPDLMHEARPKMLYLGMSREGNVFVWPVNLPTEDGRLDSWSTSAHSAASIAESAWIRLVANRSLGAYDVLEATHLVDEPEWPEKTFEELIILAFKDRLISSLEHPIVKRLRGEI